MILKATEFPDHEYKSLLVESQLPGIAYTSSE